MKDCAKWTLNNTNNFQPLSDHLDPNLPPDPTIQLETSKSRSGIPKMRLWNTLYTPLDPLGRYENLALKKCPKVKIEVAHFALRYVAKISSYLYQFHLDQMASTV